MLHVLRPYRVAVERLAIALIFTFIVADLYPSPSLSPGLIMSTVSYFQSNVTEVVEHDNVQ
ncbi:MAG: hypothetical protein AAGF93_10310 [Cyanobacteria bacterium P01_H01_bin.105]